jgi:hypothetical protein
MAALKMAVVLAVTLFAWLKMAAVLAFVFNSMLSTFPQ